MSPTIYQPPHKRYKATRTYKPPASQATREAKRFYDSKRWRSTREVVLSETPCCVECEKRGEVVSATVVDHIIPRAERPDLEIELSNLQALCASCHSTKTNSRDGGFGNRRRLVRG